MTFAELFDKHGSLKQYEVGYGPVYDEVLQGMAVREVLEIGVKQGASLLAWAEEFPEAQIVGVDNFAEGVEASAACQAHPRIRLIRANSTAPATRALLGAVLFDLIVDDGSHTVRDQLATLANFLPVMSPTGVYVVEDITSDENGEQLLASAREAGFAARMVRSDTPPPFVNTYDNRLVIIRGPRA